MEIEGSYTLQATPVEVWHALTRWQIWARDVFGIEQAEQFDPLSYRLTLSIHQAPLAGIYTQHVAVTEQHAPSYCRVTIAGDQGQLDAFDGYGIFHLKQQEHHTVIAYNGYIISGITDAQGTPIAPLVVKGAVLLLLQQFFLQLSEYVLAMQHSSFNGTTSDTVSTSSYEEPSSVHEEHIVISSPLPYPVQGRRWRKRHHERRNEKQGQEQATDDPSWLRWFVHLLGIGKGNPTEENRWTQRIRRFSIASVLLFLVWVGTRIPRR